MPSVMQPRDEEKEPAVVAPSVHKCKTGQGFVHAEEQTPYTSDLDYLQDHLTWFKTRYRCKTLMEECEDVSRYDRHADDLPRRMREAQEQERVWQHCIERRLKHTSAAGSWLPRAEQLAAARQLTP